MKRLTVIQGNYIISDDPDVLLTTVLGSCVAACVYDPTTGVGGINHFLLSEQGDGEDGRDSLYGSYLMEVLLNDLYKRNARKRDMKVKLFGGAKMFNSRFDPGKRNADFITQFMQNEGFDVTAASLGGTRGRRIEFHPASGQTRQKMMTANIDEQEVSANLKVRNHGELELF